MHFIIGGSYQGKLDYVKDTYGISDDDVFTCSNDKDIDISKKVFYHFELYVQYCLMNNKDIVTDFKEDDIVIMDDIFCGVVPIDKDVRALRECCGRTGALLTRKAASVTRIFCGLPQKLK